MYTGEMQYYGSIYKLESRILVRVDVKNMVMNGDTWYPTASMRNTKYFLEYSSNNKARVQQLYLTGALLQTNVKHRVILKLDIIYGEYFPEY